MSGAWRIFPLGDSALTIEIGTVISAELNSLAISIADHFQEHPFPGFIEAVPAYASTTIFYDIAEVRRAFPKEPTAFGIVKRLTAAAAERSVEQPPLSGRLVTIPVQFDPASSPDLEYLAEMSGMSSEQVVDIFTATTYRVFMSGFLPGFSYMGIVDMRIAVPRLETPRKCVPRGSVGIAGTQTGIYSIASPGGWRIIGRTDVEIFTPDAAQPSLLRPGDQVRFTRAE